MGLGAVVSALMAHSVIDIMILRQSEPESKEK